jgi:hypothetical protein
MEVIRVLPWELLFGTEGSQSKTIPSVQATADRGSLLEILMLMKVFATQLWHWNPVGVSLILMFENTPWLAVWRERPIAVEAPPEIVQFDIPCP